MRPQAPLSRAESISIPEQITALANLLQSATDRKELECLLTGLLSPVEIQGIHTRWELIKQLVQGKPQREIMANLGIGLGKISRGSRMLKYDNPELQAFVRRHLQH